MIDEEPDLTYRGESNYNFNFPQFDDQRVDGSSSQHSLLTQAQTFLIIGCNIHRKANISKTFTFHSSRKIELAKNIFLCVKDFQFNHVVHIFRLYQQSRIFEASGPTLSISFLRLILMDFNGFIGTKEPKPLNRVNFSYDKG